MTIQALLTKPGGIELEAIDRIIDRARDLPGAANEILKRGAWVNVGGQNRGDTLLPQGTISLILPFSPENHSDSWLDQILTVDAPCLELLKLPDGRCFTAKEDRLTLEAGKPRFEESSHIDAVVDYVKCRIVQRETQGEWIGVW